MAYAYICEACMNGQCGACERHRGLPPEFRESGEIILGGGVCICRHEDERSKFELSVIEKMERTN